VALLAFIKYLVLSTPQFLAYSKLFQRHLVLIQIICVFLCILFSGRKISARVYQENFGKSDKTEGGNQQDATTLA